MSKLAITLAMVLAAGSIIGGTYVVVNRRKKQKQQHHDALAKPEIELELTS